MNTTVCVYGEQHLDENIRYNKGKILNMNKIKKQFREINGLLVFDKPESMSSNFALQQIKRLYNASKAGHTGSLDPLASGMLPICFGEATKFAQYLLDSDKSYLVIGKLGETTTTGDREGEILSKTEYLHITTQNILKILPNFIGKIEQTPPMFSALKQNGQPLYKLARQGITVERESRQINIYNLDLVNYDNVSGHVTLRVNCSKGTYIRTLIEDIGNSLGCGAYVTYLRRTSVGNFSESSMIKLDDIKSLAIDNNFNAMDNFLQPVASLLHMYPEVLLSTSTAFYLMQGQPVMVPNSPKQGCVCLKTVDNVFLGIGEVNDDGMIAPKRLVKSTST